MSHPAENYRRSGLVHTDGLDLNYVDLVEDYADQILRRQDGDRVGFRCIRPFFTQDGEPVIDGRTGQQRRAILAGVFDRNHLRQAAELVVELNTRSADDPRDHLGIAAAVGSWNIYCHAQRVGAPITNALLVGALGCVRREGINAYTTLIADLDPDEGAVPGVAIEVAWDLVDVLVNTVGVPRGAIRVMQSGRGGYLEMNTEPQPLTARETMRLATQTIARMVEAAEMPVHGDPSVFDEPRILRVAGTINHKPGADPTTPAMVLEPGTPSERTPWLIIEKIAAKSKPKLRVVPSSRKRDADSASLSRRPLRDLFVARSMLYRERADGICDVRCPNAGQHTDGRDAAILYPPTNIDGPGWLKCSHAHCANLTLFDVFRLLEGRA